MPHLNFWHVDLDGLTPLGHFSNMQHLLIKRIGEFKAMVSITVQAAGVSGGALRR